MVQREEDGLSGVGIVELVLILAIILGLVLIFRTQVTDIMNRVFNAINSTVNSII